MTAKTAPFLPSPLAGEGGEAPIGAAPDEGAGSASPTGFSTRGTAPSSGASRHLLPRGEKEERRGGGGGGVAFARVLRKNMTDAGKRVWGALRDRRFEACKFRRQVPIGRYVVDFVCFDRKVIVEVDGSQHEGSAHDALRDAWLTAAGFRVLRFWNIDALVALDGTLLAILDALRVSNHDPCNKDGTTTWGPKVK